MPGTSEASYAEQYGYQLAFLKSDPELYALFKKAKAGSWDAAKFVAAVKNTKWYKTHGETYRQNLALQKVDPGTYQERLLQKVAGVQDLGAQMGATLSPAGYRNIAESAMRLGWDESQLRNALTAYVKVTKGTAPGAAGDHIQALRNTAWRNGVKVSEPYLQSMVKQIAAGDLTIDAATRNLRVHYGASIAPAFKAELEAGVDLYDIASPYMQAMAKELEMNPADLDLFDPTIKSALSGKGPDGKPVTKTLWEFEQDLRKDPRWKKTQGAQDQVMSVANKVLQDMGLLS